MKTSDFRNIANWVLTGAAPLCEPEVISERIMSAIYIGKVYSKGRPKFATYSGHAYTPETTRKFEAAVLAWAEQNYTGKVVYHPVSVEIALLDTLTARVGRSAGMKKLAYKGVMPRVTGGDLDNKAKAILDAIQGHIFADDSQVVRLVVTRKYAQAEGFSLTVRRCGLSEHEAAQVAKLISSKGAEWI